MTYNSYQDFIVTYSNTFHPVSADNLSCYVVALTEEVGELLEVLLTGSDTTKVVKELGDCLAYMSLVAQVLGLPLDSLNLPEDIGDNLELLDLVQYQVSVAGCYKRILRGDTGFTLDTLLLCVIQLVPVAHKLAKAHSTTIEGVMAVNQAKLTARMANGTQKGTGSDR
jgi:NTP pyrophosphatase (non-canonical NTP hydrolase)